MSFPIDPVRDRFPALSVTDAGRPRIYFDGPGGTQLCREAIAAMVDHLSTGTANAGGAFATSVATDRLSADAHAAMADFLGGRPEEIAFGPNMTSLTLAVSRALARTWDEGDALVVTRLDHDANVAPWLEVAADRGMDVRWLDFDPDTGRLRLDQLPGLLDARTRLVAAGGASNALGTVNDLPALVRTVRGIAPQALIYVDAVQSAPHLPIDVGTLGCDLLACSPYKLFGPHIGVLWGRAALMADVAAYKVRPAGTQGARRFETGTPSFEAQAGVTGMIAYLEWLGDTVRPGLASRRDRLRAAMAACAAYEHELGERLLAGLRQMNSVTLHGPAGMEGRVPTFAFTLAGHDPAAVARHLAARNIFVWSGHFYAVETVARLGLAEQGGLVRIGLCHYNTPAEVDALLGALRDLS